MIEARSVIPRLDALEARAVLRAGEIDLAIKPNPSYLAVSQPPLSTPYTFGTIPLRKIMFGNTLQMRSATGRVLVTVMADMLVKATCGVLGVVAQARPVPVAPTGFEVADFAIAVDRNTIPSQDFIPVRSNWTGLQVLEVPVNTMLTYGTWAMSYTDDNNTLGVLSIASATIQVRDIV